MKFNEFQRMAVEEAPKNITVSAAAGSGKTQVLGARVLRRISGSDPVDVSRLLIVTFTRSAASEMRSRIGNSVTDALRAETDPARRRMLERQLSLLSGADICTIDSFCYRLLRQNFFKIPGLSGDFTVGDEAAVRRIAADSLREITERFSAASEKRRGGSLIPAYEEKAARFFASFPDEEKAAAILDGFDILAMNYGSAKHTNDFMSEPSERVSNDYVDFVYRIKRCAQAVPDPDEWLNLCIRDADPDFPFAKTRVSAYAGEAAADILNDILSMLSRELADGGLNAKNASVFEGAIEALSSFRKPESYADGAEIFSSKPLGGLRIQSKDTSKSVGNPHAAQVMAKARKIWDAAAKLFSVSEREIELFRAEIAPVVLAVCELTRCTLAEELTRCMEKKKLSFSDCMTLALKLLVNADGSASETALELRELYDEIYVDEAQDIDLRQLALFEAISNGRMFMVGDVKQSIYGFRHSEPEIFGRRCEGGENSRLITMNLNYRSTPSVINTVNGVFSRLMNESTMKLDYSSTHRMVCAAAEPRGEYPKAEFIAVTDEGASPLSYNFEAEAQEAANRINALLSAKTPVFDKASGETRPIMKKDIIVLMRSVKNDGAAAERILEENGIACYFDGGESLFAKDEISPVLDILTLIGNDGRDIPLAGALRSVMFGFTENDLLKIRTVSAAHSFSSVFRVLSSPSHERHGEYAARLNDAALLERCVSFGKSLEKWRLAADFRPLGELIGMILTDTSYYSSVGAMKGGVRRRANLDALIDAAEEFERGGARGLFGFLDYIKKQRKLSSTPSLTEAKTLSESMDVVRIMSIHKSKGLEAPVIILMKCSKPYRTHTSACALDTELGFSVDYVNEEKGCIHRSPLSKIINHRIRTRESCEEIRLLYVAMTRARERLICTGFFGGEKALGAALSFDGRLEKSGAVFLADSFAKLIGSAAGDERLFSFRRLSVEEIERPSVWDKLKAAPALSEDAVKNFADLFGFSAEYPHAAEIPAKVSVSALKAADETAAETSLSRGEIPFRETLRKPMLAMEEKTLSSAEIGTAYHTVMERLDLFRPAGEQLEEMLQSGIISEAEHKLIKPEKIQALLDSSLGARMRASKRLFREASFIMHVPAADISSITDADVKGAEDEAVAVQGIIDCFFVEDDHIVLVDYKTDVYTNPQNIVKKYSKQLYYYAKALGLKFFDKKIQKYLYLFHKNDIIEIS